MVGWIVLGITVLLILLSLFFLFFDKVKDRKDLKNHRKRVYTVLKYYADEEDQLLLNHVVLYLVGANEPVTFDHILFADKYVYVIRDVAYNGGLYGNVNDPTLFLRDYRKRIVRIDNPVLENQDQVRKLEESLKVKHEDKMFVSVVVYNNSLIVPKGIAMKEQTSWFLPLKDLEKTIKTAEKDDVSPISHDKTENLVKMLKERSEQTKKELAIMNQKPKKRQRR